MLLYHYNAIIISTADHGRIMSQIEKQMARYFKKLAQEFCISAADIGTIEFNNRNNESWDALNEVVETWLKGNTEVYDEGARANVRWLVDAVRKIDKALATTLATSKHNVMFYVVI